MGDTLLIRGTGRTDFQHGDARAQYDSIFNRLLELPDQTLVYPAHDYKGDTVSTIGEEKAFNPRLQVQSVEAYADLMANLNLPNPKLMDVAIPANRRIGLQQDRCAQEVFAVQPDELSSILGDQNIAVVDLREEAELLTHGKIPGAYHVPYTALEQHLGPGGLLWAISRNHEIIFYCQYGERSAMAVEKAGQAGIASARHLLGGFRAWTDSHLCVA